MKTNQKGFTLIEVLIAITILSFIMIAVISLTDDAQERKDEVIGEDNRFLQIETALSRFQWDFNQIYSPLYFSHDMRTSGLSETEGEAYNQLITNYQSNNRFAFPSFDALPVPNFTIEEKNTLVFFTQSNRRKSVNQKQSNYAWVYYAIEDIEPQEDEEDQSETKALVRKIVNTNVFDKERIEWDDIKSQILLRDIDKLKFEFWNPKIRKWTENLRTITQGNNIIYGIKISFEWFEFPEQAVNIERVYRPIFPNFKPEDMYELETMKAEDYMSQKDTMNNDPQ